MSFNMAEPAIVISIGLAACVFDVRTRRIPNALTLGAAVAGLLYHGATSGVPGVQTAAAETFWLAMYAGIAGGVLGLVVALTHGYLKRAIANVSQIFGYWAVAGLKPVPGMTLETSKSPRLAFAIPILAGTMVTLWLR